MDDAPPSSSTDGATSASVLPSTSHISSRTTTPCLSSLDGGARDAHFGTPSPVMELFSSISSLPSLMAICTHSGLETEGNHWNAASPALLTPNLLPLPDTPPEAEEPASVSEAASTTDRTPLTEFLMPALALPISQPPEPPLSQPSMSARDVVAPVLPCLATLMQSLHTQKYQHRRRRDVESRLHCLQVSSAHISRLTNIARTSHQVLADCIRNEDKKGFATVFNAFQDASFRCTTFARDGRLDLAQGRTGSCVLNELSASAREEILAFLARTRSDAAFVTDRIVSLTHKELLALLPDSVGPQQSVFGSSTSSRGHSRPVKSTYSPQSAADHLRSLQSPSQLSALIHQVHPVNASTVHGLQRTEVWASVCAKLIVEQKPGSERFVPAVVDLWSNLREWPGKQKLELWLNRILRDGAFLLDRPNRQSFRVRMQGREDYSAEDQTRSEEFYSKAVRDILDMIAEGTSASLIPPGATDMCQAISKKLQGSGKHLKAMPYFLVTRWLSPFLATAITSPETHNLMTTHHISDVARQRILREVATRAQKAIFDVVYSWRQALPVSAEIVSLVEKVSSLFRFSALADPNTQVERSQGLQKEENSVHPSCFIAMTSEEIISIVKALYPEPKPWDGWTEVASGLQSSASSVSGMSVFSNSIFGSSSERSSTAGADFGSPYLAIPPTGFPFEKLQNSETADDDVCPKPTPDMDVQALHAACKELLRKATVSDNADRPADRHAMAVLYLSEDGNLSYELGKRSKSNPITDEVASRGTSGTVDHLCRVLETALAQSIDLCVTHGYHDTFVCTTETAGVSPGQLMDSLIDFLDAAMKECEDRSDYLSAHYFAQIIEELDKNDEQDIQLAFSRLLDKSRRSSSKAIEAVSFCEDRLQKVVPTRDHLVADLDAVRMELSVLRTKAWYVTDVRTSAVYEEARAVSAALKIMGKPSKPSDSRTPPLRHWSNSRLSGQNLHLKTEVQILELMSAASSHGGPNKLSDEQAKLTADWMRRMNIENLCVGEERLHRLCLEIRRCVDRLVGEVATDSPVLWSSELFINERMTAEERLANPAGVQEIENPRMLHGFSPSARSREQFERFARPSQSQEHIYAHQPGSTSGLSSHSNAGNMSSTSSALSAPNSRDYFDDRSLTLTNKSSATFWSPASSAAQSPSSATSISSTVQLGFHDVYKRGTQVPGSTAKSTLLDELRQSVTSLLLSDLGNQVFNAGSETDQALWHGLGGELTRRLLGAGVGSLLPELPHATKIDRFPTRFDFDTAYERLLEKFSMSSNPYAKLRCLYDLERLLIAASSEKAGDEQCNRGQSARRPTTKSRLSQTQGDADTAVAAFSQLFRKSNSLLPNLFLDLQYIAATVPSETLDRSQQGRAFCNACVAAFRLKQDICKIMVETADGIIAYHTDSRGHGRASSLAQQQRDSATFVTPSRTPPPEDVAQYRMEHAAYLLQITAREGNPAAQRELATLYLTHPELLPRIIAPFTKPKDVFKEELESGWKKNQDPNRCDPLTMCVAQHWMGLSSKGGDSLAKEYLRAREEMERLP